MCAASSGVGSTNPGLALGLLDLSSLKLSLSFDLVRSSVDAFAGHVIVLNLRISVREASPLSLPVFGAHAHVAGTFDEFLKFLGRHDPIYGRFERKVNCWAFS